MANFKFLLWAFTLLCAYPKVESVLTGLMVQQPEREILQVLQFYPRNLKQVAPSHRTRRGAVILIRFELLFP